MTNNIDKLKLAIMEQTGAEGEGEFSSIMNDVASCGADGGFPGFTYTKDCVKFYDENEEEIYELLNETAEEFGHDSVDALVATFIRKDLLAWPEGRKNLLAWFALETVARNTETVKV